MCGRISYLYNSSISEALNSILIKQQPSIYFLFTRSQLKFILWCTMSICVCATCHDAFLASSLTCLNVIKLCIRRGFERGGLNAWKVVDNMAEGNHTSKINDWPSFKCICIQLINIRSSLPRFFNFSLRWLNASFFSIHNGVYYT